MSIDDWESSELVTVLWLRKKHDPKQKAFAVRARSTDDAILGFVAMLGTMIEVPGVPAKEEIRALIAALNMTGKFPPVQMFTDRSGGTT